MSNAIRCKAMKTVRARLARAFASQSRIARICREIWLTAVTPSRRTHKKTRQANGPGCFVSPKTSGNLSGKEARVERVLFAKIEVWIVLALLLVGGLVGVGFGWAVLQGERETGRYPAISRAALAVAEIPDTAKRMLSRDTELLVYSDKAFAGKPTGWSFPSGPMAGPDGYILLSRYDGTARRHRIELISLPDMTVRHSWTLDAGTLLQGVSHISPFSDSDNWNDAHFRQIHPLLLANGDLILKDHYSPLFRVNACGARQWLIDSQVFHHSTEADADGNFWVPTLAERQSLKRVKKSFREDMLTQVSPDGRILHNVSVPQLLIRDGKTDWLFAHEMYNDDPTHLNDIEPVLADGPYWKKGDVFVSLRNISTILLYRPSTGRIVWMQRGPWLSQHDVDVLDDHRISVYDNNAQDRGAGAFVDGNSHIMVYDFATGRTQVEPVVEPVMKAQKVHTLTAGLYARLPDGSSLLEDVTDARLLIIRPDGRIGAEYVNRADDGDVYHLGWSRYIDQKQGDAILRSLKKVQCNG